MKAFVAVMIGCSSVGASAQMLNVLSPANASPMGTAATTALGNYGYSQGGLAETPSMRQKKLERAIALRSEAAELLRHDNGTLTPVHASYIRRKVCDILSPRRAVTGSNIPESRCGA